MTWQAALFQDKGLGEFAAALLVVRLAPDGAPPAWPMLATPRHVRITRDFGEADGPGQLWERIERDLAARAATVFACCIVVESSNPQSIEAARACALRARARDIAHVFGSFARGSAAMPGPVPIPPFSTMLLARTQEGLFYAPRLLLPSHPLIGFDLSDVYAVWGNRYGTLHRIPATVADTRTFIDANRSRLDSSAAISMSLWHHGPYPLPLLDEIGTLVREAVKVDADILWTMNAAFLPEDAGWTDIVLLTDQMAGA